MNEERTTTNTAFYKAMLAISSFVAGVGFFTALNIFARLVPTFLTGVVWIQIVMLVVAIILIKWVSDPIFKFIGAMVIGITLSALIGGFWDAAYLALSGFQFGETGINGLQIAAVFAIGFAIWIADLFLSGRRKND